MASKTKICLIKPDIYKADGALRIASSLVTELKDAYEFDLVGIYGSPHPYYGFSHASAIDSLNISGDHLRDGLAGSIKRFRALVRQRQYDLVICVGSSTFLHAYFACLGRTTKTVLWEHMNMEADDGNLPFRKFAAQRAQAIVVLTERDAGNYARQVGKRDVPIVVIPNWVDAPVSHAPASTTQHEKTIVSVGRVSKQKGLDLLVDVAERLHQRDADFTWDYFGSGELEDDFRNMIASHHLENRIRLMGTVPDVVNRLSGYTVFALTSRWEGLPMVLLESLTQGTPPVAFDIPTGPADIIENGVNGYLIDPFDTERMADVLETILRDDTLRDKLSSKADATLGKFDKTLILGCWRNLLDSLARG